MTAVVEVVDRTGAIIGALRPGHTYRLLDQSSLEFAVGVSYLMVRLPDHTIDYVPENQLVIGSAPSVPEPDSSKPPMSEPDLGGPSAVGADRADHQNLSTIARVATLSLVALIVGVGISFFVNRGDDEEPLATQQGEAEDSMSATDAEPDALPEAESAEEVGVVQPDGPIDIDPDDLADGQLPFRVVEGEPIEGPEALLISGYSQEFAFGMDFDAQLFEGKAEAIVIDRETGREINRFPMGEGFPGHVLDLGGEVWISVVNDRKIVVFDPGCICEKYEIPIMSVAVDFMIEHQGLVYIGDYSGELSRAVVSVIDPATGFLERQIVVGDSVVAPTDLGSPVIIGDSLWLTDSGRLWVIDLTSDSVERIGYLSPGVELLGERDGLVIVATGADTIDGIESSIYPYEVSKRAEPRFSQSLDGSLLISSPVFDDVVGNLWIAKLNRRSLMVVDRMTFELASIDFDDVVGQPVVANGYIWVPVGNQLVVVDPLTVDVVAELPGVGPADAADAFFVEVVDDALWLFPFGRDTRRTYQLESS